MSVTVPERACSPRTPARILFMVLSQSSLPPSVLNSTTSARRKKPKKCAGCTVKQCSRLFAANPGGNQKVLTELSLRGASVSQRPTTDSPSSVGGRSPVQQDRRPHLIPAASPRRSSVVMSRNSNTCSCESDRLLVPSPLLQPSREC